MDVMGKSGNYFRSNVWYWRPLWNYCETIASEITALAENAYSNDGSGLDADASYQLGTKILEEYEAGRTAEYQWEYEAHLASLPDEECIFCKGSGVRENMALPDGCNACSGKGIGRPWACNYYFDADFAKEFAEFLKASEGFEIW